LGSLWPNACSKRSAVIRMSAAVLVVMAALGVTLATTHSHPVGAASGQLTSGELAQNGGFESGVAPWIPGGNTGFAVYANGQIAAGDTAYAGTHYAAMNTTSAGGGMYQDVTGLNIEPGDTFCGSAQVRDQLHETGAAGSYVIWLIGGASNENGVDDFSDLGTGSSWQQVSTCVTATTAHSQLRIQFYPTPGTPTVDVDAVDVHQSLQVAAPVVQNGGFESGLSPWQVGGSTGFAIYANGQIAAGDTAFAGTHYAAMNTTSAGGGIFQDVTGLSIEPGDTYCGSVELRDQLQETGAAGSFVIWLIGGSSNESGIDNFSHLGTGSNWQKASTCVTATTAHTTVRVQFYPAPGTPTVDVDAVNVQSLLDVQESVSQNGSFEDGVSPWIPGGHTGFAVYANGQISPTDAAYAGTHYAAMNTTSQGGGLYEDITGVTIEPGDSVCGSAEVRDQLQETGAAGSFVIWLIGGASNENGIDNYSHLGNGSNWQELSTCVTATSPHTQIRIQFYPTPGTPTVDVDAVETGAVSSAATNPNCAPSDSCSPQSFADTFLTQSGVNAPITASNEYALEIWALAEGGGAGCTGQPADQPPWQHSGGPAGNPLNTTQTEPGSTNWNSVGVQIYRDGSGATCWDWGVLATTQTITGAIGNYGPIISAFQNPSLDPTTQCVRVATAVGNSQWGTGNFSADC
jgi:hypothetical protein